MTEWAMLNLAQSGGGGGAGGLIILVIYLALIVVMIAGMWKMFAKAGQPGWAAIIPIFNIYILCKIVNRPWWWLILFFIPIVSIIAAIVIMLDLAKSFGKGVGFAVGLILLGPIFICILGFGDAKYTPIARA
ncbi:MAG: hypothetical protein HBSAPP03_17630 [Phycisphaerae bacterium]|nr:MAG: hypothetical protein HBSAPP03_17630 [Phycisphaerae bacterium]